MQKVGMTLIITITIYFLVGYNTKGYCDDSSVRTNFEKTLQKIYKDNDEALKAIDNSVQLIKQATASELSKPKIDKIVDKLIRDVGKTLSGIDDKSELISLIIKFKQNIREKISRYRDEPEDQRFWTKKDEKLSQHEQAIHQEREHIVDTLGKILHTKYDIYKQLERGKVEAAVNSLGSITTRLKSLRNSLDRIRKMPYELKESGAPAS